MGYMTLNYHTNNNNLKLRQPLNTNAFVGNFLNAGVHKRVLHLITEMEAVSNNMYNLSSLLKNQNACNKTMSQIVIWMMKILQ